MSFEFLIFFIKLFVWVSGWLLGRGTWIIGRLSEVARTAVS